MPKKKTDGSVGPMIKYIGKSQILNKESGEYEVVPTPEDRIPTALINGRKKIDLPSGAEQKAGFYHPDAMFLVNNYRDQFKLLSDKNGDPVSIKESTPVADKGPATENATTGPEGENK